MMPLDQTRDGIFGPRIVGDSSDELVREALQGVLSGGYLRQSPGGTQPVREVMHWQTALTDPRRRLARSEARPGLFNPGEAVARFFASISGSDRLEQIRFYLPVARHFSPDGLTLSGHAHGARVFMRIGAQSQFERIADVIRHRGDGNRALITLHLPTDAGTDPVDLPCATSLFFFRRGGTLHASVQMRANNALRLFVYDVFEFSMLHEFMAVCTDLGLGHFFYGGHALHVIGDADLSAAPAVASESQRAAVMSPMPAGDLELRARLAEEESTIRYAASTGEPARLAQALRSLQARTHPYWTDLFFTLALQAISIHFAPEEKSELLKDLEQSNAGVVSALMMDYLARSSRR